MDQLYDDELTYEEREAIGAYKRAQNKILPKDVRSDEIWAPDFATLDYPHLDYVSALRKYLNELRPYVAGLTKAAGLRQAHYDHFIREERYEEEPGHRHWRILMNAASEDAGQKYDYWKKVHDDELNEVISMEEAMYSAGEKQRQKEYRREERARARKESQKELEKGLEKRQALIIPRQKIGPTETEKERLRKEQAELNKEALLWEDVLIEIATKDKTIFASGRRSTKKTRFTSLEILALLRMLGYDYPMFSRYLREGRYFYLKPGEVIDASFSEFKDIASAIIDKYMWYSEISNLKKETPDAEEYYKLVQVASYDFAIKDSKLTERPELEITPITQNIIDTTYLMLDATMRSFLYKSIFTFRGACFFELLDKFIERSILPNINSDVINFLTATIVGPMSCESLLTLLNAAPGSSKTPRMSPVLWHDIKSYIFTIYANDAYIKPLNTLQYYSLPENVEGGRTLYKAKDINFLVPPMQKRPCLKKLSDPPPEILPELSFRWKMAYIKFLNNIK